MDVDEKIQLENIHVQNENLNRARLLPALSVDANVRDKANMLMHTRKF